MIETICRDCGITIKANEFKQYVALYMDERLKNKLPYLVEIRCPHCDTVIGKNWAMVDIYYEWNWTD